MKKLLAVSLLSLALATPAFADDDDYFGPLNVPRDQWLSVSEVVQKIEAKGYKVREIEADDGVYEFEAIDSSGARVEGHAHPATGEILNTRPD
ncbi:MAG: PepSY domain-containing protein [Rhizobiales bacterium]|nr:PepSY domain-containing protein [Hyphomicrobiales bacterium]